MSVAVARRIFGVCTLATCLIPAYGGALSGAGSYPSLSDVAVRIRAGKATTICAQGDSITYGQDTVSISTTPPVNGSGQSRSTSPFPETLGITLAAVGAVKVINRGYPGDSSAQGVTRWAGSAPCDAVLLMYGHNDALNYGGSGIVSLSAFRANMVTMIDREMARGAAVAILLPPDVENPAQNDQIKPYTAEVKQLAKERDLVWIDTAEPLRPMGKNAWIDGVHLSAKASAALGRTLARVFAPNQ